MTCPERRLDPPEDILAPENWKTPLYTSQCVPELNNVENQLRRFERGIGVEWEFVGTSDPEPINDWAENWSAGVRVDRSCGWELQTPVLRGRNITDCIFEAGRALAAAWVDNSCSVHVHLDARDFTWPDIRRLVLVYEHLEPALFMLAGNHRAANDYCTPTNGRYSQACIDAHGEFRGDYRSRIRAVAMDEKAPQLARYRPVKRHDGRHKAINLMPWLSGKNSGASDCTIEFRMMGQCDAHEASDVVTWAKLLRTIMNYAKGSHLTHLSDLPKGALSALGAIAPEYAHWILDRVKYHRASVPPRLRAFSVREWRKLDLAELDPGKTLEPPLVARRGSEPSQGWQLAVRPLYDSNGEVMT